MKKVLLTVAAALASMAMFGQGADAAFYTAWSAKHNANNQFKLAVLDFSDSAMVKEWRTARKEFETSAENSHDVSYDATEKALKIAYKYLGTAANDNYSGTVTFGYLYTKKNDSTSAGCTTAFNPFLEKDSIVSDFINMTDSANRSIRVTYKVKNLADSASMRIDIYDVNGRKTNNGNSAVKKQIKQASTYQTLVYNWCYDSGSDLGNKSGWNEDAIGFADGYSGNWWGINTGHWNTGTTGLPKVTADPYKVNLDTAFMLPKFLVQFNSGGKGDAWVKAMAGVTSPALDKEFEVYIKKVEFGDFTSGQDLMFAYDGTLRTCYCWINDSVASKIINNAKKISPNIGSKFAFEGKGTMVNILGQVIAEGTNSINADAAAAGVYYIIIDGVGSKVIVK